MTDKLQPCILPWVNFCTNPYGRSRPCGYSKFKSETKIKDSTVETEFNNDLYKKVRLDFLAGKWPENCSRCQFMEEVQPGKSKKFSEQLYSDLYSHLIKETNPDGSVNHFPKQIDIRLGTVCNLKCIHCGTGNSSKWNEDKEMIGKYSNTERIKIDNSWVDRDSELWQNIKTRLPEIEKFNFLGGEPFASRQHGRLIEYVATTPYASKITLHYVTNGTLLTEAWVEKLKRFQVVTLNVSFDGAGKVLEFYRFPIDAKNLEQKLLLLDKNHTSHFGTGLQWTSSNISMFYLNETLDYVKSTFKNLEFKLCNFVDSPVQMSPQNLPHGMKDVIRDRLRPYLAETPDIDFYIQHMYAKDLWPQHGTLFLNYLDDLTRARSLDWKQSLRDFHLALRDFSNQN